MIPQQLSLRPNTHLTIKQNKTITTTIIIKSPQLPSPTRSTCFKCFILLGIFGYFTIYNSKRQPRKKQKNKQKENPKTDDKKN